MNRKTLRNLIFAGIGIPVLIVAGFSLYVLGHANKLPFQSDPTRIPVTPFANIASVSGTSATAISPVPGAQQPVAVVGNDGGSYDYSAATTPAQAGGAYAAAGSAATADPSGTSSYGPGGSYGNSGSAANVAAVDPATAPPATTAAGGTPAGSPKAGGMAFMVVADQSEAKITVHQRLVALPAPNDAVLTTKAFQGQLVLGADGKPTTDSLIRVDLRTLKSDEPERDNYIRGNTLQSDQFPLAEYKLTGVSDWTGPLQDGQTSKFTLTGQMTIHGTTKPVTFETMATRHGDTITGTADTKFKFQDFGMSAPDIAGFVKATDTINLHVSLTAKQQ